MNLSRFCKFCNLITAKPFLNHQNYSKVFVNATNYYQRCGNVESQVRQVSTVGTKRLEKEEGLVKKVIKKIPFFNVERSRLMAASYLLYEEVADKINYLEFFEELDLPDTFYSWFVITELHIWMITVRVMAESDDGRFLRNSLIEALWRDVNHRVKRLGAHNPSIARAQISELAEQLQAALIAYDEGLQSDDTILAGALWRRFYQQKEADPQNLEILVKYIRRQIRLLDHLSKEQLLTEKAVNWEPLKK